MGKLQSNHIIETIFWALFAIIAFYFTFDFDQPIEIYKFGAAAWPRGVILFILVAAIGNLYWHWRHGALQEDEPIKQSEIQEDSETPHIVERSERSLKTTARVAAMLALPFVFAYLMEDLGFYALTPFFIVGIILLMGERRWKWILGVTALVYFVILLVFAKLLYVGLPTGNVHPFYDFSNWLLVLIR